MKDMWTDLDLGCLRMPKGPILQDRAEISFFIQTILGTNTNRMLMGFQSVQKFIVFQSSRQSENEQSIEKRGSLGHGG